MLSPIGLGYLGDIRHLMLGPIGLGYVGDIRYLMLNSIGLGYLEYIIYLLLSPIGLGYLRFILMKICFVVMLHVVPVIRCCMDKIFGSSNPQCCCVLDYLN